MVGRDAVAENAERLGAFDFRNRAGLHPEVGEEWRVLDVCALGIPLVRCADGGRDFSPSRVGRGKIFVKRSKHFRLKRGLHRRLDFGQCRPDVFEKDVAGDWFGGQVNVRAPRERKRHHQWRRHQEVRLHVLMDARLEVAVTG